MLKAGLKGVEVEIRNSILAKNSSLEGSYYSNFIATAWGLFKSVATANTHPLSYSMRSVFFSNFFGAHFNENSGFSIFRDLTSDYRIKSSKGDHFCGKTLFLYAVPNTLVHMSRKFQPDIAQKVQVEGGQPLVRSILLMTSRNLNIQIWGLFR